MSEVSMAAAEGRKSPPASAGNMSAVDRAVSQPVTLPNATGLHARPAAVLAAAAKRFRAEVRLVRGEADANAKSVVAIVGLGAAYGDSLSFRASGEDAATAVRELADLLASGCGETPHTAAPAPVAAAPLAARALADNEYAGVSASPGLAIGRIFQFRRRGIEVVETGGSQDAELAIFERALEDAWQQIALLKRDAKDGARQEILSAHMELLSDPDLIAGAEKLVGEGKSAGFAWRAAYSAYADRLRGLNNALLRERADDITDVGRRVLALIVGVEQEGISTPPGSILIAEDLTPSDTVSLDRDKVVGFCTVGGGATSHVAILARSLGLPAVCGIDAKALALADGTQAVLDGLRGTLRHNPSVVDMLMTRQRMAEASLRREHERGLAHQPARTLDGHRIEVAANIRNAQDAREAVAAGCDGVGLLRSEFLFEGRETAPSEAEQAAEYCAVAEALGRERPLVVRTLDVGGDKPLAYMPLPREDNPFLGLRGIRVSLAQPDFFRAQLRAIGRAASLTKLHIMFPMVATIEELRIARRIAAEELPNVAAIKLGVMIEVPSAALMAEHLAREADFFSIGTNDLTQYVLAMDRGHPQLARQADSLHPSVLRMIELTVRGAHRHGRWVGVCGGMASDPLAVPALIGLGIDELSVSVPAIAQVKAAVARLSRKDCEVLVRELLDLDTAQAVRDHLLPFAEEGPTRT